MAINAVHDFTGRADPTQRTLPQPPPVGATKATEHSSFADLVKDFASDVNDLQFQAQHSVDMLATGKAADVHQVMIAVEEASIALDLMLEVRNRVLEGYQELIRMQV